VNPDCKARAERLRADRVVDNGRNPQMPDTWNGTFYRRDTLPPEFEEQVRDCTALAHYLPSHARTAPFHAKRRFSSKALLRQAGGFEGFGPGHVLPNAT
jgi:hypothetical protein